MDETFAQFEQFRSRERRVALATLVATRGASPKKEGARMWVGEGGRILGSVTIGGCVDAQVIAASEEILASGESQRLSLELGDEDAWDLGLTCSGTVEVWIEPVDLADPSNAVAHALDTVRTEAAAGRYAATVMLLHGSGARLVVLQDGTRRGTLGDAALDGAAAERALALIAERALALIAERASRTVVIEQGDSAHELFIETHGPTASLYVIGAGAIAMPLVTLAKALGLRTVVIDGRPRFATRDRFPDADELRIGIPSEIVETLPLGAASWVVLVAHDYKYDLPVLRTVLQRDVPYIGLLGSRRRGRAILDFLREEGIAESELQRIRVPVGLDIGARTAPEIALSILAEAIAVRASRPGTPLREREEPG